MNNFRKVAGTPRSFSAALVMQAFFLACSADEPDPARTMSASAAGASNGSGGVSSSAGTAGGGTPAVPGSAGTLGGAPSNPEPASNLGGATGGGGGAAQGGEPNANSQGGGLMAGGQQGTHAGEGQGPNDNPDPTSQPELNPDKAPGANFDLSAWKITFPDGTERDEAWLVGGGQEPGVFFTDPQTGGMVFKVPNIGGTTSNSSYSRTELREMLRAGNTSISTQGINQNNWVLSTSSSNSQAAAGGVDGALKATLRVDQVSTTGESGKVGRVIVGQIHASNNEPCRLYYRKLPGNPLGSVYFAYEPNAGAEQFIEMIGSRSNNAASPPDGIALGEVWSYTISAEGNSLEITIQRPGHQDLVAHVDMSEGALENDWMYFKAGAYNQNNTGSTDDYAQVTFFALKASHQAPR